LSTKNTDFKTQNSSATKSQAQSLDTHPRSLDGSTPPTPDRSPNHPLNMNSEFANMPSASLQTVIKHNEDLMARLSVNLRRVGHLEKVVEDLNMRFKIEKSSADSLRDELLIYTEKNRLTEAQLQKMTGELSRSHKKIEQLQIESQAVLSELKSKESKYEFKISQLELEIHELVKIKDLADTHLRPQIVKSEEQIKSLQSHLEDTQDKYEDIKDKLLSLSQQAQSEALRFQNISKDLQAKLKDKEALIAKFESLDEKLKTISKDKALIENKNIDLEHELKKVSSLRHAELERLQAEISAKNSESQKLKIENYELKKSWSEAHNKSKDLDLKNSLLEEQAQSMQYMWQEKNRKHTELESQIKILETMRHELSLKVRTYENEVKIKNTKINDLLILVETMQSKGQHEKEAILETAIRGMKSLYFEEDEKPSADIIKTISF
jgi:chromosome segregation ATPase